MRFLRAVILLLTTLPFAAIADDVSVTAVAAQQRYPWNGLVDIMVTMHGSAEDVSMTACSFAATNCATKAALKISHVTQNGTDVGAGSSWTRKYIWDSNADLGEVKIEDIELSADAEYLGGVQLWENGAYWAQCNVGATKPEERGYYFWWGDTIGSSSSYSGSCPISDKSLSQLQSLGYLDHEAGHYTYWLTETHDAARAYLGSPWRMPWSGELSYLWFGCDHEWINRNGVGGYLFKGRGAYSSNSIFLPCDNFGRYWSNEVDPYDPVTPTLYALGSGELHGLMHEEVNIRCFVRPVRDRAQ